MTVPAAYMEVLDGYVVPISHWSADCEVSIINIVYPSKSASKVPFTAQEPVHSNFPMRPKPVFNVQIRKYRVINRFYVLDNNTK